MAQIVLVPQEVCGILGVLSFSESPTGGVLAAFAKAGQ